MIFFPRTISKLAQFVPFASINIPSKRELLIISTKFLPLSCASIHMVVSPRRGIFFIYFFIRNCFILALIFEIAFRLWALLEISCYQIYRNTACPLQVYKHSIILLTTYRHIFCASTKFCVASVYLYLTLIFIYLKVIELPSG